MADDKIRLSQVVGVFGPGAMLDLPERSVLVQGLDDWEMFGTGTFKVIEEPRLARLLYQRLVGDGRLAADRPPELRTPPIDRGDPRMRSNGIKVSIFPRWFVCETVSGDPVGRRRLVRFQDLHPPSRQEHRGEDNKRRKVSPIRFVCGCEKGHLQDIEWRRSLHSDGQTCRKQMWLEESSTSADPRDTRVVCDCGAALSLEELFQPQRLGTCFGERPWIGDRDPNGCDAPKGLRLLIRSATNTYFPQVARVISLPLGEDELAKRLAALWSVLSRCASAEQVAMARLFNPQVHANLEGYSDLDVFSRISSMAEGSEGGDAAEDPRFAEFALFSSGRALIGDSSPNALLHAETLPRDTWDPSHDPMLAGIATLVAVHRLREVTCIYGFTRFEPSPLASDELEDVGLAVSGAPLAKNPDWLPSIDQYGEGIFLQFCPDALTAWLARDAVRQRVRQLQEGVDAWAAARRAHGMQVSANGVKERERPDYVMAHGLAHALMSEVAIDCGYPASALKERVYSLPRAAGEPVRCGIMIYTASAGNQGTLGGLVDVTRRFARVLASALDRLRLCSGDPVCADHEPAAATDDRALHGAACHGCLLVAETSCEARNLFLDRALLVDTVGTGGSAFFN
jgi:hypothetical protein